MYLLFFMNFDHDSFDHIKILRCLAYMLYSWIKHTIDKNNVPGRHCPPNCLVYMFCSYLRNSLFGHHHGISDRYLPNEYVPVVVYICRAPHFQSSCLYSHFQRFIWPINSFWYGGLIIYVCLWFYFIVFRSLNWTIFASHVWTFEYF